MSVTIVREHYSNNQLLMYKRGSVMNMTVRTNRSMTIAWTSNRCVDRRVTFVPIYKGKSLT